MSRIISPDISPSMKKTIHTNYTLYLFLLLSVTIYDALTHLFFFHLNCAQNDAGLNKGILNQE